MATFTESFDKTDGNGLGPDLIWTPITSNPWMTVDNTGSPVGTEPGNPPGYIRAESDTTTVDQYAQANVLVLSGANTFAGVCVRFSSDVDGDSYLVTLNTLGDLQLLESVNGVFAPIGSTVPVDITNLPKILRIEVQGTSIRCYWDSVLEIDLVDTDITFGTRAGLFGVHTPDVGDDVRFDNFEYGDLGGGGTSQDLVLTVEIDTGQLFSGTKQGSLFLSPEVDTGQSLVGLKSQTLGLATEVDTSLTLTGNKQQGLIEAIEVDEGLSISGTKDQSLDVAVEANEALSLSSTQGQMLGVVEETDTTLALTGHKNALLGTAVETDTTLALFGGRVQELGTATEANGAVGLSGSKVNRLSRSIEIDLAQALQIPDIIILEDPSLQVISPSAVLISITEQNTLAVVTPANTLMVLEDQ